MLLEVYSGNISSYLWYMNTLLGIFIKIVPRYNKLKVMEKYFVIFFKASEKMLASFHPIITDI